MLHFSQNAYLERLRDASCARIFLGQFLFMDRKLSGVSCLFTYIERLYESGLITCRIKKGAKLHEQLDLINS